MPSVPARALEPDPLLAALAAAPVDDEPLTDDEEARLAENAAERAPLVPHEAVRRDWLG